MWNASQPFCAVVNCGPTLSYIENGMVTYNTTIYMSNAHVVCDLGYQATISSLYCGYDGQWAVETGKSGKVSCKQIYCKEPDDNHTEGLKSIKPSDLTYRSNIVYFCAPGYRLNGLVTRSCQLNGSWSGVAPYCQRIICSWNHTLSSINDSQTANSSLSTQPIPIVTTTQNTTKSLELIASSANITDDTRNATGVLYTVSYGVTVAFRCPTGYVLSSEAEFECIDFTDWSPDIPICEPVLCSPLPYIQNGDVEYSNQFYGAVANYSCDPG